MFFFLFREFSCLSLDGFCLTLGFLFLFISSSSSNKLMCHTQCLNLWLSCEAINVCPFLKMKWWTRRWEKKRKTENNTKTTQTEISNETHWTVMCVCVCVCNLFCCVSQFKTKRLLMVLLGIRSQTETKLYTKRMVFERKRWKAILFSSFCVFFFLFSFRSFFFFLVEK